MKKYLALLALILCMTLGHADIQTVKQDTTTKRVTTGDLHVPSGVTVVFENGSTLDTSAATSVGTVPATRTVNGHALNANVTITYTDVGAQQAGVPFTPSWTQISIANVTPGGGATGDDAYVATPGQFLAVDLRGSSGGDFPISLPDPQDYPTGATITIWDQYGVGSATGGLSLESAGWGYFQVGDRLDVGLGAPSNYVIPIQRLGTITLTVGVDWLGDPAWVTASPAGLVTFDQGTGTAINAGLACNEVYCGQQNGQDIAMGAGIAHIDMNAGSAIEIGNVTFNHKAYLDGISISADHHWTLPDSDGTLATQTWTLSQNLSSFSGTIGVGQLPTYLTTSNTTGTVTFNTTSQDQVIYNTGTTTISSMTITLPAVGSSRNGELLTYMCNCNITSLTISGTVLIGTTPPSSVTASTSAPFIISWRKQGVAGWIRVQ